MKRRRKLILILSATATATLAAWWVRSWCGSDLIQHTAAGVQPGTEEFGVLGTWAVFMDVKTAGQAAGALTVVRARGFVENSRTEPEQAEAARLIVAAGGELGWKRLDSRAPSEMTDNQRGFFRSITEFRGAGFQCYSAAAGPADWRVLAVPLWFLAALSAAPGAWVVRSEARSNRRRRTNQCVGCGYDLTAAKLVCPECGRDVVVRPYETARPESPK